MKETQELSPKSHNLLSLSEKANLYFSDDEDIFLGILMKYQLQGRYPDYNPNIPSIEIINDYYNKTSELLQCLKQKL